MFRLYRPLLAFTLALAVGACDPAADAPADRPATPPADAVPETPVAAQAGEADADHDAHHAAPGEEGELLLTIMQRLGSDMVRLTLALMTEDRAVVAEAAEDIAAHAPISADEIERIHTELGDEMARFEELDEAVHLASALLRDAARTGALQEVVDRLNEVQSGCVACHAEFRERLRTVE